MLRSKKSVLAALHYKGPEAKLIALAAAFKNCLKGQAVSRALRVAFPDAAVQAVVCAYVADFNQPSDIYVFSVDALPYSVCL